MPACYCSIVKFGTDNDDGAIQADWFATAQQANLNKILIRARSISSGSGVGQMLALCFDTKSGYKPLHAGWKFPLPKPVK